MILRRRFKKRIAFDDFIQQMRRNGWHIEGMGMDSKRYPYFVTMTKKEAFGDEGRLSTMP